MYCQGHAFLVAVVHCRQLQAESSELNKQLEAIREEISNLTSQIKYV